jgi:hypothetical protein
MALSMKNTFISLSLTGVMMFAGYLAGEQPFAALSQSSSMQTSQVDLQNTSILTSVTPAKKNKRTFTTPYFSFGKSNLPVGVR